MKRAAVSMLLGWPLLTCCLVLLVAPCVFHLHARLQSLPLWFFTEMVLTHVLRRSDGSLLYIRRWFSTVRLIDTLKYIKDLNCLISQDQRQSRVR